jgi:hypothetical protein
LARFVINTTCQQANDSKGSKKVVVMQGTSKEGTMNVLDDQDTEQRVPRGLAEPLGYSDLILFSTNQTEMRRTQTRIFVPIFGDHSVDWVRRAMAGTDLTIKRVSGN